MRGLLSLTAFLFIFQTVFGQLYISPSGNGESTYVYVREKTLFVEDDIRLMKNPTPGSEASLYLRSGAELLQGENQSKSNSGTGSISIFAKGSTNSFDYNYWSSPVAASENDLFGISMFYAPVSEIVSKQAQLTTALSGTANPLTISTRWIYTFHGNGYSNWNFIGGNTTIPTGYGFSMKGVDGKDLTVIDNLDNNPGNSQRYEFRGRPNSGTIEIPVSAKAFMLVGNPYPSTFDLSLFLLENSGNGTLLTDCYGAIPRQNVTTGIAYFWDSKVNGSSHYLEDYIGGYGAFSPVDPCTSGIYEPPVLRKRDGIEIGKGKKSYDNNLPVAQGFMVQGAEGGNLIFKNTYRKERQDKLPPLNSHPAAAKNKHLHGEGNPQLARIQLVVSIDDQYERKLSLAFWKEATPGIDAGMDAKAFQLLPTDAGWLKEDESFVIDVRPFEILEEIPLFLRVDTNLSKMTFSQGIFENVPISEIFVVDTQTNEYFSITKEPLTLELHPGIYHGRFKLAFAEKIAEEELPQVFIEDEELPVKFDIFQNNYQRTLQIIGNDHYPVKAVGIFNLEGKRMLYRSNFDNRRSIEFSTESWANGVYLVKVTNTNNQKTIKKITVYNN